MSKKLIITVAVIDVQCPECGEFLASHDGAQNFTLANNEYLPGMVITCYGCLRAYTLPALPKSIAR